MKSYDRIQSIISYAEKRAEEISGLIAKYSTRLLEWKPKMQYHLNIIDELHINENSNSRILYKLLNYRSSEGNHKYLDSLLKFVTRKNSSFGKIELDKVRIYQEKFRIDLLVISGNQAIIFENKIYNAADADAQLSRYIDKVKAIFNIEESNIYIIYLSNSGKEPELQSWGNYRYRFKDRYLNLSFKEDIREWIKDIEVSPHENFLKSAKHQYADYLDGLFNDRDLNKKINMELQKIIKQHLRIDDDKEPVENIHILEAEIANVSDIREQMKKLLKGYYNRIFEEWKTQTEKDYPSLSPNKNRAYRKSLCEVSMEADSLTLVISLTDDGERLYCQAEIFQKEHSSSQNSITETLKKTLIESGILESFNHWAIWKYFEYKECEKAFDCFKMTINALQNIGDHANK